MKKNLEKITLSRETPKEVPADSTKSEQGIAELTLFAPSPRH